MRDLTTQEEVDQLLAAPAAVLLKHGAHCPVSAAARDEIATLVRQEPAALVGGVEVTGQRALSDYIAGRIGVEHASPQVFVVSRGAVRWKASHREIRSDDVVVALLRAASEGAGAGRG